MIEHILYSGDVIICMVILGIFIPPAIFLVWITNLPSLQKFFKSFAGVNGSFYSPATTMFAFTAAFLGASIWGNFISNTESVKKERQALFAYIEIIEHTPSLADSELRPLVKDYIVSTLEDEWPLLVNQQISEKTSAIFDELYSKTVQVAMTSKSPIIGGLLTRAIESLQQARLQRVGFRWRNVEPLRWVFLLSIGFLAQLSIVATHLDKPGRPMALAMGINTLLLIVVVGLIALSANPYVGVVNVSPEPLKYTLELLNSSGH